MNDTKTTLNNQSTKIRNLEAQMGQMASMLNEREQGTFHSSLEVNPRGGGVEHDKAITLRSGRELKEPRKAKEVDIKLDQPLANEMGPKSIEEVKNPKSKLFTNDPPPYVPKFPFPQRLWKP